MSNHTGSRMFLVRHGATEWSRTGQHTGRTDIPLEPEGRLQAEEVGRRLAGLPFERVLSSPLQRAWVTCELAGFGDRATFDDDLLEWDYGDYEGKTTPDIRRTRPGWSLWADGVPNGESAEDVGRRVDAVIDRARTIQGDTLCFAHGHVLRVLAARWVDLDPTCGSYLVLDPGSLSVLGWEREAPVIARWNEAPPPPD
jgi:broad specificity phosphatase PhoE